MPLGLLDHLLQQELRRHQAVAHSFAHVGDGVVHLLREVAQALGVVVVVLRRGERKERRQLRGEEVDAADLRDRHLPLFESDVFDVVAQVVRHERLVHRFLLGEAGGVDALEPLQKLLRRRQVALDRGLGVVGGLVVVAPVAEDGGEFRDWCGACTPTDPSADRRALCGACRDRPRSVHRRRRSKRRGGRPERGEAVSASAELTAHRRSNGTANCKFPRS